MDKKELTLKKKDATFVIDTAIIINNLQGKWMESEYPFRVAHFKNMTVKFIEEGTEKEPSFHRFKISNTCPFNVNNIKNAQLQDIFLVMSESKTCDILKLSNDSLTLSGFNVSSGHNYKIVYSKVE